MTAFCFLLVPIFRSVVYTTEDKHDGMFYNVGQNFGEKRALLANFLTWKWVKRTFIPSPPTQCCLMGFAIRQALFSQHDSIDNFEIGAWRGRGG